MMYMLSSGKLLPRLSRGQNVKFWAQNRLFQKLSCLDDWTVVAVGPVVHCPFAYPYIVWHLPPPIPFYNINNISVSVKRSNFTLAFIKATCHTNPGGEKNEQDQKHISQDKYFKSLKMHQLTIMYHFEYINHDNPLKYLFQNLYKLFLCDCNLH